MPPRRVDDRRRRLRALEGREETLLPRPVAGALVELRRDDDRAALAHHRRRSESQVGRRARCLIEVRVLRLTDAGDHDVVLLRDRARVQGRRLSCQLLEHTIRVPRRDGNDTVAIVRDDVETENQSRAPRELANCLVERVAFEFR